MMKRMMLGIALLAWLSAAPAVTAAKPAAAASSHAPAQSPEQTLRGTVEHLQQLIKKNHDVYKAHPEKFYKVVDEVVVPRFDVPYISQLVLSRYWRTANAKQRSEFEQAFTDMLIRSYANALLDNYDSVKVKWKPTRLDPQSKRATVDTELIRDNGQQYPISFSLHKVDGEWKIYDIVVNNLSLALNFRSQIIGEVKRVGLDQVIAKMQSGEFGAKASTTD